MSLNLTLCSDLPTVYYMINMFEGQLFEESNEFDMIGFGLIRVPSQDQLFKSLNKFDEEPNKVQAEVCENMVTNIENLMTQKKDPNIKIFKRKPNKSLKKAQCGYKKNICGYITKKIIREFVGQTFRQTVQHLCDKYGAVYAAVRDYYTRKIQIVTGPSHIPGLTQPDTDEQIPLKSVFREFFEWFLKERYIRYLLLEGKMDKKQVYIRYKNEALLQLIQQGSYIQKDAHDTQNSSNGNTINITY